MLTTTDAKKREYWDHFVTDAYEHNRFPHEVTGPRLRKVKLNIWPDADFWDDVVHRHGGENMSPHLMAMADMGNYFHCRGNFWGMITQALHIRGML